MSSFYTNLPGVQPTLVDGNLQVDSTSSAPKVLVLGTAGKGVNYNPVVLKNLSSVRSEFGLVGTLARGAHEVKAQGADNVALMRIGGTAAVLEGIGVDAITGGYTVTTDSLDDEAGDAFSIWYDAANDRLVIYDVSAEEWVLDTDGVLADEEGNGDIVVTGTPTTGEGSDIGSVSAPVLMSGVSALSFTAPDLGVTYTAGTDGSSCSRMELYEKLYKAYGLLDFYDFDIVVPMDAYLDDLNIADLSSAEIASLGLASLTTYPTMGASNDVLGKVYVEEYLGVEYFWWDTDDDGIAEIYPSIGSAGPSAKIDGTSLSATDFHEVNFGYQLARFCHRANQQWQFPIGAISVKLPTGYSLSELSSWIGKLPEYTTNSTTLEEFVNSSGDNGTGLLGNKWLAGAAGFRGGAKGGGFVATEGSLPVGTWLDGIEETDENDAEVDIGKYISVVAGVVVHTNNFSSTSYISTMATSYAGMVSRLRVESAPTNKVMRRVRLLRQLKGSKLDDLAGIRLISLVNKPKGVVVTDAPTAARPDSDYTRLTTVRIVKDVVQTVRDVSDPFLGEGNTTAQREALRTAIETKLQEKVPNALERYDFDVTATPAQRVAGQAEIPMVLVPAYELRQISLTVSLAAE